MSDILLKAIGDVPPHRPAVDDGRQSLSYGDLRRSVEDEQRWLEAAGVRRCALHAGNGTPWVVSDLALLTSGIVNVPVPGYFSREQTQHVLDDAGIEFLLTDHPARFADEHPDFLRVGTSNRTGLALLRRQLRTQPEIIPADVAKITYTSGSTAQPKGVCLSAATIVSVAQSLAATIGSIGVSRHLCLLPLATLLENIAGIYTPLLLGAHVVVPPGESTGVSYGPLNPDRLLQAIAEASPESLVLVPELLRLLVHATRHGWTSCGSLKFIAVGGASVSPELLQQAQDAGLPVYQGYGLSECASVVCLNTPSANRPGSVGRPLPHVRVRVDTNGEICVRGTGMSGYLGDAHRPATEIRTGDLGEVDADGFVYVRGRIRNMFITSMGRNVTPEWVERELTCEPIIAHALVTGEGRPYAVALLCLTADAAQSRVDRAIANANERLPDYARIRRWARLPVRPATENEMLTPNGRLRRDAIVARFSGLIESLYEPQERANAV
jgi:long-subunit acyl-CoA synthetase (AMP-forming)